MLSKSIIIILSILALALSVSSRPYANTTLATRQTNSTRPLATRQILGAGNGGGTQGAGNGGQSIGSLDLNSGDITGGVTIEQAIKMCGKAQLECCRKDSTTDDTLDGGSIGAFFGSGDFDIQCNPIEFPIIAVQIPMNKICHTKAACCENNISESGLVSLDCTALEELI